MSIDSLTNDTLDLFTQCQPLLEHPRLWKVLYTTRSILIKELTDGMGRPEYMALWKLIESIHYHTRSWVVDYNAVQNDAPWKEFIDAVYHSDILYLALFDAHMKHPDFVSSKIRHQLRSHLDTVRKQLATYKREKIWGWYRPIYIDTREWNACANYSLEALYETVWSYFVWWNSDNESFERFIDRIVCAPNYTDLPWTYFIWECKVTDIWALLVVRQWDWPLPNSPVDPANYTAVKTFTLTNKESIVDFLTAVSSSPLICIEKEEYSWYRSTSI